MTDVMVVWAVMLALFFFSLLLGALSLSKASPADHDDDNELDSMMTMRRKEVRMDEFKFLEVSFRVKAGIRREVMDAEIQRICGVLQGTLDGLVDGSPIGMDEPEVVHVEGVPG